MFSKVVSVCSCVCAKPSRCSNSFLPCALIVPNSLSWPRSPCAVCWPLPRSVSVDRCRSVRPNRRPSSWRRSRTTTRAVRTTIGTRRATASRRSRPATMAPMRPASTRTPVRTVCCTGWRTMPTRTGSSRRVPICRSSRQYRTMCWSRSRRSAPIRRVIRSSIWPRSMHRSHGYGPLWAKPTEHSQPNTKDKRMVVIEMVPQRQGSKGWFVVEMVSADVYVTVTTFKITIKMFRTILYNLRVFELCHPSDSLGKIIYSIGISKNCPQFEHIVEFVSQFIHFFHHKPKLK